MNESDLKVGISINSKPKQIFELVSVLFAIFLI